MSRRRAERAALALSAAEVAELRQKHGLELLRAVRCRARKIAESRTGWWWSPGEADTMAKFFDTCVAAIEGQQATGSGPKGG